MASETEHSVDVDSPKWWLDVASHYGALRAIGLIHPGEGVLLAIKDLGGWVNRHRPKGAEAVDVDDE